MRQGRAKAGMAQDGDYLNDKNGNFDCCFDICLKKIASKISCCWI